MLTKTRHGDRDVDVAVPDVERLRTRTPVLVDYIISTARTMIETVKHLRRAGLAPPICMGVHGVFAGQAHDDLIGAGAARMITTITIPHATNVIDVSDAIGDAV